MSSSRGGAGAPETASISPALDGVDATEASRRFRGNAPDGHDHSIVTGDSALADWTRAPSSMEARTTPPAEPVDSSRSERRRGRKSKRESRPRRAVSAGPRARLSVRRMLRAGMLRTADWAHEAIRHRAALFRPTQFLPLAPFAIPCLTLRALREIGARTELPSLAAHVRTVACAPGGCLSYRSRGSRVLLATKPVALRASGS